MTEQEMSPAKTLAFIQSQVKAPKGQFNAFGKYKYRSAEDILEAVKLVINPLGYWLTISDEIVQVGDRIYVKATVTLFNGVHIYRAEAYAREEDQKKGMDGAQVTGAASSYARKYALSGLFALDDTKDADATNTHEKEANVIDFENELKLCKNSEDLVRLYNQNRETVENNAKIKALFTAKKNSFKSI